MAYDEELAERIRDVIDTSREVSERKMFGGLAFMVGGNMACGVVTDKLMLRLGPEGTLAALSQPHVREMDFTGKAIRTMVFVEPDGLGGAELARWVTEAVSYAASLPPK
jgi:TfoX/Sxy family transcriptional regulator of competence genes